MELIGDKRAGGTLDKLNAHPYLFRKLRERIQKKMKFIHVIRNPFDNISSIAKRSKQPLESSMERYFFYADCMSLLKKSIHQDELYEVRHEEFLEAPKEHLRVLCVFLELDVVESYLNDCSSIVFPEPRKTKKRLNGVRP